ncbi:MAG TPA: helix-turn-helix transcriptional regulator [Candidatus Bathyarchaeia archaeon]|nr:helix-turn-helix transcriptional regulator [Candidatus Bathyarchaeia archaeon]
MSSNLTARQEQIIEMKAMGFEAEDGRLTTPTNKLIAEILGIAESTVGNHLSRAYATLGVPDETSAVIEAIAWGEIKVPALPLL